ncbi:hypothetical protein PPYR_13167 [Photinus pyralis]|uniref:Uncharacterized protein n=1 Tax=Photinus pyralis TaxID=7054 RepID=A0A5N4A8B4_PHOPY|nr:uncharacterized protein LOC116178788 [Photinus pyralis]KAB0793547.1 hypothetical protein PPYR_13167 [Photinus pyralis]
MSKSRVTAGKSKPGPSRPLAKKFQIPALSIPIKEPPLDPALERLKKKTVRRNAPAGEDIKKIREIIKGLNREVVTVQEFVALVSPHTGDNGNVLRSVMVEDLANFRKLAKQVYDTMTQDVSDVLANEQIRVTDYFNERYTLNMDKMMRGIDEIFRYSPNFDFDTYYTDPDYLNRIFPLPKEEFSTVDPEELAMQKRQEVYHRLQWMRSEGARLNEENTQLQARLKQLKRQQKQELMKSYKREEEAEQQRNQLEATEAQLQNRLEDLNESVERGIIQGEEELRLAQDVKLSLPPKQQARGGRIPPKQKPRRPPWNVRTAKSIEDQGMQEAAESAASTVSTTSVLSKTGAVKKVARPRIVKKKPPPKTKTKRDLSPFHYSPPRTPPDQAARPSSPFHYSPPKSPPGARAMSPEERIPSRTVRYENTTTVVEQLPPEQAAGRISGRRNLAPRDTWRGFQ